MNLTVETAPTVEPISGAELKLQSRIDSSAEDTLLEIYITAAREKCEEIARRAFVTQTLALWLDAWPDEAVIQLPRPPLQSVSSITYTLEDGTEETLSSSLYVVDANSEPGRLALISSASWPGDTLIPIGGIKIEFVAGFGDEAANVPQIYRMAVQLLAAHWYENREATVENSIGLIEVPFGIKALLGGDRTHYGNLLGKR